jgi:hypothetical protein
MKNGTLSARIFPISSTGIIAPVLYRAWLRATSFVLSLTSDSKLSNLKKPLSSIGKFCIEIFSCNLIHG